jgi:O-antigen ligase
MLQAYSTEIYPDDQYDSTLLASHDPIAHGKSGPMDWLLALYLFTVAALEATSYYYLSTYLAYIIFSVFIISFNYGQVVRIPGLWILIGFIVWMFFVALLAQYRTMALIGSWYITKILLASFIFMARCNSLNRLYLYLKAIILGAMFIALSGAILGYTAVAKGYEAQKGLTSHTNALGIALFSGIVCSLILLPSAGKIWKLIIWSYFAAALIAVLASASRGATVACAIAVFMYFALEHILHLKRNIKIALPAVALTAFIPWLAVKMFPYSPLILKMSKLIYGGREATSGRLDIYRHAWSMFLDKPFQGYGAGTYLAYTGFSYTHTTVLEVLVAAGILGFVLYYAFYVYAWVLLSKLVKIYRDDTKIRKTLNACRSALLSIAAYGAFTVVIYQKGATILIACMVGLTARWITQLKHDQQVSLDELYNEQPRQEYAQEELWEPTS